MNDYENMLHVVGELEKQIDLKKSGNFKESKYFKTTLEDQKLIGTKEIFINMSKYGE